MITTASQICLGVTGSIAKNRHTGPSPGRHRAGISGSTTATIARNLQAVTTSPVCRRSESCRMRPFEWSTSRTDDRDQDEVPLRELQRDRPGGVGQQGDEHPDHPGALLLQDLVAVVDEEEQRERAEPDQERLRSRSPGSRKSTKPSMPMKTKVRTVPNVSNFPSLS